MQYKPDWSVGFWSYPFGVQNAKDSSMGLPKASVRSAKIQGPLEGLARAVALGKLTPSQARVTLTNWQSGGDISYPPAYGLCTPSQLQDGLGKVILEVLGPEVKMDVAVRRLRASIVESILGPEGSLGKLSELVSQGKMTSDYAASILDAFFEGKPVSFRSGRVTKAEKIPVGFYDARKSIMDHCGYLKAPLPSKSDTETTKSSVKNPEMIGTFVSDGTGEPGMAAFSPTDASKIQAQAYKSWISEIHRKISLPGISLAQVESLLGQLPSVAGGERPSYEEVRRFLRWAIGHSIDHTFLTSVLGILMGEGTITNEQIERLDREVQDFRGTPIGTWLHVAVVQSHPAKKAFTVGDDNKVTATTLTAKNIEDAKQNGTQVVETPGELAEVWLRGSRGGEETLIAMLANLLSAKAINQSWAEEALSTYHSLKRDRDKAETDLKVLSNSLAGKVPSGKEAIRACTAQELDLLLGYVTESVVNPAFILRTHDFMRQMALPEGSRVTPEVMNLTNVPGAEKEFIKSYKIVTSFYPSIEFPKPEVAYANLMAEQRSVAKGEGFNLNHYRRILAGLFAEGAITHSDLLTQWASVCQWGVSGYHFSPGTDRNRVSFDHALEIMDNLAPGGHVFEKADTAWATLLGMRARRDASGYHESSEARVRKLFAELVAQGEWSETYASLVASNWKTMSKEIGALGNSIFGDVEDQDSNVSGRKEPENTANGNSKEKAKKMSKKEIALGTVKSDLREIALRTGVKRTRAALTAKVTDFWTSRTVTRIAGESDADYAARAAKSREGVSAFLLSDAGQNALAYLVGMAWPMLEDQIEDEKVREYGGMVAREIRVQGGTDLLDGFLVEVALPLLGLLTEEAKQFGRSVLAPAMEAHTPKVRVDHAADTAANDIRDREIADLKRKLEALEANATPPVAPQVRNAFGG